MSYDLLLDDHHGIFIPKMFAEEYHGFEGIDQTSQPLYCGLEALVSADDTWLNIRVDSDSRVMLNVETIPYLIKALKKLEAKQKKLIKSSVDASQN